MTADFVVVSVFVEDDPFRSGNPLGVFPEAHGLSTQQMQAIAQTLGFSETSFVTSVAADAYDVRIFTPEEEMPFAGHPTLGTAWVLRHLRMIKGDEFVQSSPAGRTRVLDAPGDRLVFVRPGRSEPDLEKRDPDVAGAVAAVLGLERRDVELEARELGRSGLLRPAYADAGLHQLMVPVRNVDTLAACRPDGARFAEHAPDGTYCFTAVGAGRLRARGFWPGVGVGEDPGTGSAAAALGLYLAERLGPIEAEIIQGVEMRRPCRIGIKGEPGQSRVTGTCSLLLSGRLERLPSRSTA